MARARRARRATCNSENSAAAPTEASPGTGRATVLGAQAPGGRIRPADDPNSLERFEGDARLEIVSLGLGLDPIALESR